MGKTWTWYQHAEEPAWSIRVEDGAGMVDYDGATFELKLVALNGSATALTKTSGIVGYSAASPLSGYTSATSPSVVATWAPGELAAVDPGTYKIICTPTVSGRDETPIGGRDPDLAVIVATPPAAT